MITLDLSAANNATWSHGPISLLDDAGAPIEIDGTVAIAMQLRSSADSKSVALELTRENGRLIVVDALAATIRIEVPVSDMRDVPAGAYATDIVVTYQSGRVRRPAEGTVTIVQGVTRTTE